MTTTTTNASPSIQRRSPNGPIIGPDGCANGRCGGSSSPVPPHRTTPVLTPSHTTTPSPASIRPEFSQADVKRFLDGIDAEEIIALCHGDPASPCFANVGAMTPQAFRDAYVQPLENDIATVVDELNNLVELMTTISTMDNPTVPTYCSSLTSSDLFRTIFGPLPLRWIQSTCMKNVTIQAIMQVQQVDRAFFTQTCPALVAEMAAAGLPKNAANMKGLLCYTRSQL